MGRLGHWILAGFLAGTLACARPPPAMAGEAPPEIRLEGVKFRYFRGELLAALGSADVATFQRDTGALRATGLTLRVQDRGGPIDVSAPEGDGRVANRTFEVRGGVRAIRGDDHAATESARFDRGLGPRGMVVGDDPVELWGPGYRLRGGGFTFDPSVQVAVLRGGTRLVTGTSGGAP